MRSDNHCKEDDDEREHVSVLTSGVGAGAVCFAVRQANPPCEYDLDHHRSLLSGRAVRRRGCVCAAKESRQDRFDKSNDRGSDTMSTSPPTATHSQGVLDLEKGIEANTQRNESMTQAEGECAAHTAEPKANQTVPHDEAEAKEEEGAWVMVSNAHDCNNFALFVLPDACAAPFPSASCGSATLSTTMQWLPLLAYAPDVMVMGVECFRDFLLLSVRRAGTPTVLFGTVTSIQHWWQHQPRGGATAYAQICPMRVEDWIDLATLLTPPPPPSAKRAGGVMDDDEDGVHDGGRCLSTRASTSAAAVGVDADECTMITPLPYGLDACGMCDCFDAMVWRVEVSHLIHPSVQYELTYHLLPGTCKATKQTRADDHTCKEVTCSDRGDDGCRGHGPCRSSCSLCEACASAPIDMRDDTHTDAFASPHAIAAAAPPQLLHIHPDTGACMTQRLLRREWVPGLPRYDPADYDGVVVWVPSNYAFTERAPCANGHPPHDAHTSAPTCPTCDPLRDACEAEADAALRGCDGGGRRTRRIALTPAPTALPAAVVRVPVFLCWRRDRFARGGNPLLLRVYGSYGDCSDVSFAATRLCLLDGGVVWAMAAVRGGGELGMSWRDAGRKLQRGTSVNDFISVAAYLADHRWCAPGQVISSGDSAGGFVVFAAMNYAPHVFGAVMGGVPFVDCLNTLLDDSLPLTVTEWDEFGNPASDAQSYHLLRALSPTESVPPSFARPLFPHVMMLTSWSDTRVGHWESMKLTARLREAWSGPSAEQGRVLLHYCDFDSGHGGATGRYAQLRDIAREYAFVLIIANMWK